MARIGFVGLGNMGGPMARNLLKAGHEVRGYDLSPAALEAFAAAGGLRVEPRSTGAETALVFPRPRGENDGTAPDQDSG